MAGRFGWKDVAGTARKWIDQKVAETAAGDQRAEHAAEARRRDLGEELRTQATVAAATTAFPSLGRLVDRQDERRLERDRGAQADARETRRSSVVVGSSAVLAGRVSGRIDDLAVVATTDVDRGTLTMLLEPVDAAALTGGTVTSAGFAVSGFHGPGSYELDGSGESLDPGVHHVTLAGDDEGATFYWAEGYGPGVAVVSDDLVEASLVCRNAADEEIRVTLRVPLA